MKFPKGPPKCYAAMNQETLTKSINVSKKGRQKQMRLGRHLGIPGLALIKTEEDELRFMTYTIIHTTNMGGVGN